MPWSSFSNKMKSKVPMHHEIDIWTRGSCSFKANRCSFFIVWSCSAITTILDTKTEGKTRYFNDYIERKYFLRHPWDIEQAYLLWLKFCKLANHKCRYVVSHDLQSVSSIWLERQYKAPLVGFRLIRDSRSPSVHLQGTNLLYNIPLQAFASFGLHSVAKPAVPRNVDQENDGCYQCIVISRENWEKMENGPPATGGTAFPFPFSNPDF